MQSSADESISHAAVPAGACIVRTKTTVREAGEMMLAIARLTRVSDGSDEMLEEELLISALGRLPKAVSFTEFREAGVYTESRSPVGSFSLIGLLGGERNQPTQSSHAGMNR